MCERRLTRHKISCREPSAHATQHTLPTADTPSAGVRLARGQLHPWLDVFSCLCLRIPKSRADYRYIHGGDRECEEYRTPGEVISLAHE